MADLYNIGADLSVTANYVPGPTAPARIALSVTPSDTKDLTNSTGTNAACYAKALYIGTTGNVAVVTAGDNTAAGAGTALTFNSVPVGWFPVAVRRVMNTNTTASNIIALFDK